jgi:hypothetical protein
MYAKAKKEFVDDLGNARKIRKMTDDKFRAVLLDFIGNWPFGRFPAANVLLKSQRKKFMSRWKSYLKSLGVRLVTETHMERATRHACCKLYIRDPATEWRDAPFGGTPAYIEIPRELALKILVLEALP